MSNIQLTRDFIAMWEAMDADAIIDAFTDEPFYHNIPMPPLTSKAAIREFIDPFFAMTTEVKWETHFIAEDASLPFSNSNVPMTGIFSHLSPNANVSSRSVRTAPFA
ncbi:MAG: nuclear transport factor 2 family protein, partial [Pseudomonadota bacterium]